SPVSRECTCPRPPACASSRFAHTDPQLRIEFSFRALRQEVAIRILSQHRKNCGTRAGHEPGAHFWLLEQKYFQLRQKNKLFENGALQIIRESLASELLTSVRHAWNFA